jgi:Xaa-Pro aminopeptidase
LRHPLPGDRAMTIEHTYPRFSEAEYARRHREVRERMDAMEISALLCCGFGRSAEINYLANWRTTTEAWLIFPREGESTLLIQLSNHLPNAKLMSIVDDVRFAGAGPTGSVDSVPSIVASLKDRGLEKGRVGIVGPMPYQHHDRIRETLPSLELVDFSAQMRDQRQIKSADEIEWLRASAAMSDRSIAALAEQARPGITEHECARIIEDAYLGDGGINQIHFVITTSMHDAQGGVPRQYMSDRVLRKGDVLVTEISANAFGYVAQVLRTMTIGEEPTDEYRALHETAMEAFACIEAALKPGATVDQIMDAAEVIHERGFTVYDDLVHGEGQLPPIVRTRQQYRGEPPSFTYREGQCYVIQPNVVTADAMRGVQFGEMMHITANGAERLHTAPRQLFVCEG